LFLSFCMLVMAADDLYPEHGRVIEARAGRVSELVPTFTDPLGKVRKGRSVSKVAQIYRVETATRIYEWTEVGKKPHYAYGQEVAFRVNDESVFLNNGKKERKLAITGTEKKKVN
jgi:hypothetical protein